MNDIRKTIGYADFSWNPVTGCRHNCWYCYARKIAERRSKGAIAETIIDVPHPDLFIAALGATFPAKFEFTFYPHRMDEPARKKRPSTIFAVDMGDLLGNWVPMSWIIPTLDACAAADWHRYLFLTKNAERYKEAFKNYHGLCERAWLGTTITSNADVDKSKWLLLGFPMWASFEPLLGPITNPPMFLHWAVIGGLNHAKRPADTEKWAGDLIRQLRDAGIPVWVKGDLFDVFPYRETPWGGTNHV